MFLDEKTKQALMKNFERADALDIYAEVKLTDSRESWSCYICALDPMDEDTIMCILDDDGEKILSCWSLKALAETFDSDGECVKIDDEYRRKKAVTILTGGR